MVFCSQAVGDFRQREPLEGTAATERTEVRVVRDATTLYIGIVAHDGDPDAVIARILQRDRVMDQDMGGGVRFTGDDAVAVLLDTFDDHRNAFVFATNPNGAEFDALLTDEGREFNKDWRGIWRVASARTADGWSAEFAIPFSTLRYRDGQPTWGINVARMIRRKNEDVIWQGWERSGGGFVRVSRAGHLTELETLGLFAQVGHEGHDDGAETDHGNRKHRQRLHQHRALPEGPARREGNGRTAGVSGEMLRGHPLRLPLPPCDDAGALFVLKPMRARMMAKG